MGARTVAKLALLGGARDIFLTRRALGLDPASRAFVTSLPVCRARLCRRAAHGRNLVRRTFVAAIIVGIGSYIVRPVACGGLVRALVEATLSWTEKATLRSAICRANAVVSSS